MNNWLRKIYSFRTLDPIGKTGIQNPDPSAGKTGNSSKWLRPKDRDHDTGISSSLAGGKSFSHRRKIGASFGVSDRNVLGPWGRDDQSDRGCRKFLLKTGIRIIAGLLTESLI